MPRHHEHESHPSAGTAVDWLSHAFVTAETGMEQVESHKQDPPSTFTKPDAANAAKDKLSEEKVGMSGSRKGKHAASRGAPMLSWMKVPIEIQAGGGIPLSFVQGLQPTLEAVLLKGSVTGDKVSLTMMFCDRRMPLL